MESRRRVGVAKACSDRAAIGETGGRAAWAFGSGRVMHCRPASAASQGIGGARWDGSSVSRISLIFKHQEFGRPFVAPEGVPAKWVAILRKALMAALKDDDLLKDAKKSRLVINPVSGEEVTKLALELFALPKSLIKRTNAATKFKKKN